MKLELCKSCRFWVVDDHDEEMGECRRYPPTSDKDIIIDHFPITRDIHWCGEWQEAER